MTSKNSDEKHDLSDEELMVLYQASDYFAFETLYRRQSGRIYCYLKTKVDADSAQELLQETFARIHKSRDKYNPQYPFLPWIFTIARNLLFDHLKKAETQTARASVFRESEEIVAKGSFTDIASLDNLEAAMSELSDRQQMALKRRYLDDWSFERIANDLSTTPQNARQLISRSLRKVKLSLEKDEAKP